MILEGNRLMMAPDDLIEVIEDETAPSEQVAQPQWIVLVVDDDPDVHAATRFGLAGCKVDGRPLIILSAHSAAEGRDVLAANPDVAVLLLDVVMEEQDAGLKFVEWMRGEGYERQRVILRTGQPGYAPELDVIRNYDINDYKSKGELTQTRLITAITTAIRTYSQFRLIDDQRFELQAFSYALAHDFKQTTRQILIFSDRIIRSGAVVEGTPMHESLSFLCSAARRMGALVDVLSQYSLMGLQAPSEVFEVADVIAETRRAVAPILAQTKGELSISGSGVCQGNPALIGQVLQVLISNGLQHNESPVPSVEVRVEPAGSNISIFVADNGVGIEPEFIGEIFKPHRRIRYSPELTGTGLGLTLSRRAVEAQGGAIHCRSKLGDGTEFEVVLPAVNDEMARAA